MLFFDIFASPRWSPLRMRTKVVSFFIFSKSFQKKIKALRPKMTKIASRGSCLKINAGIRETFSVIYFSREKRTPAKVPPPPPKKKTLFDWKETLMVPKQETKCPLPHFPGPGLFPTPANNWTFSLCVDQQLACASKYASLKLKRFETQKKKKKKIADGVLNANPRWIELTPHDREGGERNFL